MKASRPTLGTMPYGAAGSETPWTGRFLDGLVVAGLFVVATTEALGAFRAFRFPQLAAAWGIAAVAAGGILFVARRAAKRAVVGLLADARGAETLWLGVGGILLVTGLIAVVSPPTVYDSLTYHMARVAHWVQDGSVAHYFTPNGRQLYLAPFAEFVVAQFQVLAKGDRLSNAAQWIAFAGSSAGAAAVAGRLGADQGGRALAAVVATTIPMAILQASSSQTDLVASCWALIFVWNLLTFLGQSPGPLRAAGLGASLGLGLLTKATLFPVLAPFVAWLVLDTLGKRSWRRLGLLVFAGAMTLLVNLPSAIRNGVLFGAPLGPPSITVYSRNHLLTPGGITSNLLRGVAVHLGVPEPRIRHAIEDAFASVHRLLGVDVSDRRTTLPGAQFFIPSLSADENVAGNPIHLALAAIALPALLAASGARESRRYVLALLAAAFLFCGFLKWQPWISRLQLPLFVLAAPAVAAWVSMAPRRRWGPVLGWLLVGTSLPFLFLNSERPLVMRRGMSVLGSSRAELMFGTSLDERAQFEAIVGACSSSGVRRLGLVIGSNSLEYPYWALLNGRDGSAVEIRHILVPGIGAKASSLEGQAKLAAFESRGFVPDAIIRDETGLPQWNGTEVVYLGRRYMERKSAGPLRLFVLEPGDVIDFRRGG